VDSTVKQLEIAPGCRADVRACSRAFVVCWPSTHASGARYWWESLLPERREELPLLPEIWLAQLRKPERRSQSHAVSSGAPLGGRIAVKRNVELHRRGSSLQARGFSDAAIEAALLAENRENCSEPLTEGEVLKIVGSVLKYPKGTSR
jgi:hypothetical protein